MYNCLSHCAEHFVAKITILSRSVENIVSWTLRFCYWKFWFCLTCPENFERWITIFVSQCRKIEKINEIFAQCQKLWDDLHFCPTVSKFLRGEIHNFSHNVEKFVTLYNVFVPHVVHRNILWENVNHLQVLSRSVENWKKKFITIFRTVRQNCNFLKIFGMWDKVDSCTILFHSVQKFRHRGDSVHFFSQCVEKFVRWIHTCLSHCGERFVAEKSHSFVSQCRKICRGALRFCLTFLKFLRVELQFCLTVWKIRL